VTTLKIWPAAVADLDYQLGARLRLTLTFSAVPPSTTSSCASRWQLVGSAKAVPAGVLGFDTLHVRLSTVGAGLSPSFVEIEGAASEPALSCIVQTVIEGGATIPRLEVITQRDTLTAGDLPLNHASRTPSRVSEVPT
jgi:hypothetical protein